MNRRRKRERPSDPPPSLSKRPRRPPEPEPEPSAVESGRSSSSPSLVMVASLPVDCTVLELKSRLEVYGPISRIRIDVDGSGYVAFRSDHAAEAAISASIDPTSGITIRSKRVLVVRAIDPLPEWRMGVGFSSPSTHLRAETPPSRLGHKKLIADSTTANTRSGSDLPYKGREIIAYDDLL